MSNSAQPIGVTAVITPLKEEFARVQLAMRSTIEQVVQEPGCIRYEITDESGGHIILTEQWESAELLDLHLRGSAVRELGESLNGLLACPPHSVRSDQLA